MTKKVGVLLAGCGFCDGSEIHEAVLTLLALDRAGAEIVCMAPDVDQYHVINHITQEVMEEKRNVLLESARIARGDIFDLKSINAEDLDALILPGGFGTAKNLSDFAIKGPDCMVQAEVAELLEAMISAGKPIGAICIAPATLVRALAAHKPQVTIGHDAGTAAAIETMGGSHVGCDASHIHVDAKHHIVSTPAYMLGPGIKEVALGIEKLVEKVLELTTD